MNGRGTPEVDGKNAHGSIARAILFLLASPILWSGHFFLVYGLQSPLCALGVYPGRSVDGWEVAAPVITATVVVLSAQLAILLRPDTLAALLNFRSTDRQGARFAISVSRFLTVLAMLGVAWTGLAALLLEACSQLR